MIAASLVLFACGAGVAQKSEELNAVYFAQPVVEVSAEIGEAFAISDIMDVAEPVQTEPIAETFALADLLAAAEPVKEEAIGERFAFADLMAAVKDEPKVVLPDEPEAGEVPVYSVIISDGRIHISECGTVGNEDVYDIAGVQTIDGKTVITTASSEEFTIESQGGESFITKTVSHSQSPFDKMKIIK